MPVPPAAVMPNQTPNLFGDSKASFGSPVFCWLLTIISLVTIFLFLTVLTNSLNIWLKVIIMLALSLGSTLVSLRTYVSSQKPSVLLSLIMSGATLTGVLLIGGWAIYVYESLKSAFSSF